jgi:hypothetical protein
MGVFIEGLKKALPPLKKGGREGFLEMSFQKGEIRTNFRDMKMEKTRRANASAGLFLN